MPIRRAEIKIQKQNQKIVTIPNAGKDAEKLDLSHTVNWNVRWYSPSENSLTLKKLKHTYGLTTALLGIYPEK